ncbi:MAG: aldolase catalytic domain-containing protein [Candidatus Merdivicinus sp.]
MSTKILDCTLRDGGYVNDWRFGKKTIASILEKLEKAGVDIIECGFLTRMVEDEECSLFPNIPQIEAVLPRQKRKAMYVAMIAIGEKELHPTELTPCDGKSIDGIRLTFHKGEIDKAIEWAHIIQQKGYQVFMQPVGTGFYSDLELLQLVEKINNLKPYAFYIVDTLGSMYRNEVSHRFYLIDENMDPAIHLGFHGHNNLQLAFSNAQVLGKIQTRRTLILDSSVNGMGRGAGNLPTELITQYINKNIAQRYDVTMLMDIYDEYIVGIRKKFEWGYSVPYHIAASNVCHPNYASYLLNRQTLTMKDIEKIIQSIPEEYRILYDRELIEELYMQYQSRKIDDRAAVQEITDWISGREILLLAPGKSLISESDRIREFIRQRNPFVIAVNFADSRFPMDACFVSSHKRMDILEPEIRLLGNVRTILTSNLSGKTDCLYVDYTQYTIPDAMISDNAGLMLLNLLRRCGAQKVSLAGFDGFRYSQNGSYYREAFHFQADEEELAEKQKRIAQRLQKLSGEIELTFLTPSIYEKEIHNA